MRIQVGPFWLLSDPSLDIAEAQSANERKSDLLDKLKPASAIPSGAHESEAVEMAYFAYGYFVKMPNGIFHSGHDFGPTLDSYKVGDSLGVRNGVEGIIVGVLKGEAARRSGGYDVFVLLEQRAPGAPAAPAQDFFQTPEGPGIVEMLTREPPRLVSRCGWRITKFCGNRRLAQASTMLPSFDNN